MEKYSYCFESPIGSLYIAESEGAITDIGFHPILAENRQTPLLLLAEEMLREYFDGKRRDFDIPISLEGTEFQMKAWGALRNIPYGQTRTYKEQAEAVGNAKASRAVGAANGKNPVSIIIPCHRVIGTAGKLVGYGGGLERKKYLLDLERRVLEVSASSS